MTALSTPLLTLEILHANGKKIPFLAYLHDQPRTQEAIGRMPPHTIKHELTTLLTGQVQHFPDHFTDETYGVTVIYAGHRRPHPWFYAVGMNPSELKDLLNLLGISIDVFIQISETPFQVFFPSMLEELRQDAFYQAYMNLSILTYHEMYVGKQYVAYDQSRVARVVGDLNISVSDHEGVAQVMLELGYQVCVFCDGEDADCPLNSALTDLWEFKVQNAALDAGLRVEDVLGIAQLMFSMKLRTSPFKSKKWGEQYQTALTTLWTTHDEGKEI